MKLLFPAFIGVFVAMTAVETVTAFAQSKTLEELADLPGGTTKALGHVDLNEIDLGSGPKCEKGFIVVPENRAAESSRNIGVYFYRLKARNPTSKSTRRAVS